MEYKEHAFTVHGREIRFSRAQDIYNAIEQQFWPRYNETVKDFDRFYSSNISSFEDIFRYLPGGADSRIRNLVISSVGILPSAGVLSYTPVSSRSSTVPRKRQAGDTGRAADLVFRVRSKVP